MSDPLIQSVAASMRSTEVLRPEDSLERAAALLRNTAYPFVPIVDGERLIGAVSESSLAIALAESRESVEPCTEAAEVPPTIDSSATGAEALRRLTTENLTALVVVDETDRVLGVVGPSDLAPQRPRYPTPPSIGGMATPFGVYLTTGTIHGGAKSWALMASGAMLLAMFLVASELTAWSVGAWPQLDAYGGFIAGALFLLSMRLLPISGTHAAEHMVVHAIERGEPLTPEVVRRMPRVHPRCGTNLAVAASVFLAISEAPWTEDHYLRAIVAMLVTVLAFRPLGSLVQFLITTKPPTDKQLAGGIRAGKELLERYRIRRGPVPNALQRILNSGMLHVVAGSSALLLLLKGIDSAFHLNMGF